jgi:hypothetical protein
MSGIICKLPNGNYLLWSTGADAPLTPGMPLSRLEMLLRIEEGEDYMEYDHPRRMRFVEEYGTSNRAPCPTSFEELIRGNRAGPNESELSLEEIVEKFGTIPKGYTDAVSIANVNRCEICIDEAPDDGLSDMGVCGACGEISDVWDMNLVALYVSAGFSTDEVWRHLPRLRSSQMPDSDKVSDRDFHERLGRGIARVMTLRAIRDNRNAAWRRLTGDEQNILEHYYGMHSGLPQTLEIEADKPVVINGKARGDLPVPSSVSVEVMRRHVVALKAELDVFEDRADGFRVRWKPFEDVQAAREG